MEIPRFLRRGRCVKPIIAEETGRGKRFFDGGCVPPTRKKKAGCGLFPHSALMGQSVKIGGPALCLVDDILDPLCGLLDGVIFWPWRYQHIPHLEYPAALASSSE